MTYYPEPLANYDRVQLIPRPDISGGCLIGAIASEGNGVDLTQLYYCRDVAGAGQWGLLGEDIWQRVGDDIVLVDMPPKFVGIGLGDPVLNPPEFKLTLMNNAGIIAKGTYGPANPGLTSLGNQGVGTAFFWYPKRAVLRAGYMDGSDASYTWSDASTGSHSVAFGKNNLVYSAASTIGGGERNSIGSTVFDANHSFIGGGYQNIVLSPFSAIVGGGDATLPGNEININSDHSFIGGGYYNLVAVPFGVVVGGSTNHIYSDVPPNSHDTIGGGSSNTIWGGRYNVIFGGELNEIQSSSDYGTIGGGLQNVVNGQLAAVHGGDNNAALNDWAVVAGGQGNAARGAYSAIAGGFANETGVLGDPTSGQYAVIGGGQGNRASYDYSVILGGQNNVINTPYSFIGGGENNQAGAGIGIGDYATVAGGYGNIAGGNYSFVGGGANNAANGAYSVVPGGFGNQTAADYSWAAGANLRLDAAAQHTFVWGFTNPDSPPLTVSAPDAFIIYSNYDPDQMLPYTPGPPINVGINTRNPDELLHVRGSVLVKGQVKIASPPTIASGSNLTVDAAGMIGKDIAETFLAAEELEPGDIVVSNAANPDNIQKSSEPYARDIVGIVSAAPAIVFEGSQIKAGPSANFIAQIAAGGEAPVALLGQVICKVTLENGPIKVGDLLTSSSLAGHAMKATDKGRTLYSAVAKALQPFAGGENGEKTGEILVIMVGR